MLALVALVVSIGFVDSLNPSTILPALYFATGARPLRAVAGFALGVLAVNLAGGVILALGPGQAMLAVVPRPGPDAKHALELGFGAAAVVAALLLWLNRERVKAGFGRVEHTLERASPIVGATIAAVELPTAFPYFAVIAAVVGSGRSVEAQAGLLVLFNAIFVAPLGIVALMALAGGRAAGRLEALRARLLRHSGVLVAGLALAVAVTLLALGSVGIR